MPSWADPGASGRKERRGGARSQREFARCAFFIIDSCLQIYVACNVRTMWCNVIVLIFIFNIRVFEMPFNCVKCYDFSYYISLEYYLDLHCLSRSRSRRALCSTFYLINANEISMNSTFMN